MAKLKTYEKQYKQDREQFKKDAHINATKCLKECSIAETATATGKIQEASYAIFNAEWACQEATKLAEKSRAPEKTTPNFAERTAKKAEKQFEITIKKIQTLQNKTISTNQSKELGAD